MVGQPTEPSSEPAPAPRVGDATSGTEPERYGPLALDRLHKDDGRSLIIYSRAEPAP